LIFSKKKKIKLIIKTTSTLKNIFSKKDIFYISSK